MYNCPYYMCYSLISYQRHEIVIVSLYLSVTLKLPWMLKLCGMGTVFHYKTRLFVFSYRSLFLSRLSSYRLQQSFGPEGVISRFHISVQGHCNVCQALDIDLSRIPSFRRKCAGVYIEVIVFSYGL